mmetsp:Transcript_33760/g.62131  ORF Transcript_33760/g.62131 Transcript_33760/m.62131 type:complete len:205 (+) Transcript_33760:96-710(+)
MKIYNSFLSITVLWAFMVCNANGFSPPSINRSCFLKQVVGTTIATITSVPAPSNADIEFVPASPYFSGTYQDAVEIMYAQRIAVDNIASVINDGNIEEAGFKVMQLNAQTQTAGKIILDTIQENIPSKGDNSITLLRFLSCQKKFASLLDLCEDCGDSLQSAMKGKSGAKTAGQIKSLRTVEETKSAYDDFLGDLKTFEKAIGK